VILVSSLLLLVAVAALGVGVVQSVMPLVYSSFAAAMVFGLLLMLSTVRRRSATSRADAVSLPPEDGSTSGSVPEERTSMFPADAPPGPPPAKAVREPAAGLMFPGPAIFGRLRRQPPVPEPRPIHARASSTARRKATSPPIQRKAASPRSKTGATRKPAGARSR